MKILFSIGLWREHYVAHDVPFRTDSELEADALEAEC